ncbi:Uncharacterised protein [Klebsiella quasipneumoniae]|uniref:DUF6945 domain-containing protein n=1 Tax=Klebsiella/Raoultella group TaxID=2890311 RepID=UPI000E2D9719|nr:MULTISPECIES: hypothetical protein [Klebsiella/Raoultella group]QCK77778.1 hypothetical protein E4K08_14820 [Raoultella ornithinolytica]UMJ82468.1 hypothetical protein JJ436_04315 [Klebsiella pneumoniae]SXC71666.1 Uncharacterised protein [Klebsiella quasipneumoniae]
MTTETEKYITVFKRLQYATHIVRRDTGEEIKNRIEVASFYGYMRDQYTSYSAKDLEFFESMESMGLKFQNTDRRTVKKWLDVLNAIGLVISDKRGKDERGYDRYYHTVIPLEEIADNLLFYGSASISGGLLAEGMLIRSLEKKKPRGKPKQKSGDKQGDGNCHKEGAEAAKTQAATADQSVNLAPEPALDDSEQRSGVESDREHGSDSGTDDTDAVKPQEPKIFDEHGVITEAFINSLTGDVAPNRNADGTLQSFRYVYWVARHTQDALDGISTRTKDEYMAEAREWHIPSHLLSTPTTEPEYEEDPNFLT